MFFWTVYTYREEETLRVKKWFETIFDHKISLRERMFRIVTGVCMVALLCMSPMGRNVLNWVMPPISLITMAVIVKVSIQKDCIQTGATAISVLLLILFPICFFSAGGFYSGVPEWFVICFIYICITLEGRRMYIFFLFCMGETLLCYYAPSIFQNLSRRIPRGIRSSTLHILLS